MFRGKSQLLEKAVLPFYADMFAKVSEVKF